MKWLSNISWALQLLILGGCGFLISDSEPELPPVTTEGAGTFGCLVNDKLFLPDAPLGFGNGVFAELQAFPDTLGISIYATNSTTKQTLVMFFYGNPTLEVGKVYDLTRPKFSVNYIDYSGDMSCRYQSIISGNVMLLKVDIANPERMIVSGTFDFVESSMDCQDTITVTDGRFDINDVTYQ